MFCVSACVDLYVYVCALHTCIQVPVHTGNTRSVLLNSLHLGMKLQQHHLCQEAVGFNCSRKTFQVNEQALHFPRTAPTPKFPCYKEQTLTQRFLSNQSIPHTSALTTVLCAQAMEVLAGCPLHGQPR